MTSVEEGQPVVFRHEGAHRRRCRERARAYGGRDDGQGARRQGDGPSDPRGRRVRCTATRVMRATQKKRAAEAAGVSWAVKEKAKPGRPLTTAQRARNRRFGKVRAKVEHVFRVREMPVRLSQGALSRHRQERRAGVRAARARQPLSRPRPTCVCLRGKTRLEKRRVLQPHTENPNC